MTTREGLEVKIRALLIFILHVDERPASGHLFRNKKPRYTLSRRLGGPQKLRFEMWCLLQTAFHEKVPAGGVGSGVFRGESVLVGELKGCYWSRTVWRIRELHYYIQTENISSWEQRVVSAPVLCTVGVVIMFYTESHWIHQNTWNTFVCYLFSGCGMNVFRMACSNTSPAAKSCACAYIAFLLGISS
jgi:hypothetical protein